MTEPLYSGVEFWAVLARKGSARLTGVVLIVNREIRNGESFACVSRTDAGASLPAVTWTHDDYIGRKCVKVDEVRAREIDPTTFKHLDAHHRSPEYRAMYASEIRKPGRNPQQRAYMGEEPGIVRNSADKFRELYGA